MDLDDDYEPSQGSSASSIDPDDTDVVKTEDHKVTLPIRPATPVFGDSKAVSRKRPRSVQGAQSVDAEPTGFPFKRQKGTLNTDYVAIYNMEIKHISEGYIEEESSNFAVSQIGSITWTPLEKERFFTALERVSRHNPAEIARRTRTKGELEVRQYLALLEEEDLRRRQDMSKRDRVVRPVDVPPAAEISQETCNALERAADDLSLRQQALREKGEQRRWEESWLVTPALATFIENQIRTSQQGTATTPLLPFSQLLMVRNWLVLSDRVFMNSTVPELNWQFMSEEPPSIRATALQDFHTLVESITRRLVATTIHVAASRIDAKMYGDHRTRGIVKVRDVRAAATSLGLPENSRDFWARSARRLRLEIHADDTSDQEDIVPDQHEASNQDNPAMSHAAQAATDSAPGIADDTDHSDLDEELVMSYHEVEAALGLESGDPEHTSSDEEADMDNSDSTYDDGSAKAEDLPTQYRTTIATDNGDLKDEEEDEDENDIPAGSESDDGDNTDVDQDEVDRDLWEALEYAAETYDGYAGTVRSRQAIRRRIEREHRLEAQCERTDAWRSAREEESLRAVVANVDGTPKYSDKVTMGIEKQVQEQRKERARKRRIRRAAAMSGSYVQGMPDLGDDDSRGHDYHSGDGDATHSLTN